MIASAVPATPRGPSGGDDASGFQQLLAALLPGDNKGGVSTEDGGSADGASPDAGTGLPDLQPAGPDVALSQTDFGTAMIVFEPLIPPAQMDAGKSGVEAPPDASPVEKAEPGAMPVSVDARQPDRQDVPDLPKTASASTGLGPPPVSDPAPPKEAASSIPTTAPVGEQPAAPDREEKPTLLSGPAPAEPEPLARAVTRDTKELKPQIRSGPAPVQDLEPLGVARGLTLKGPEPQVTADGPAGKNPPQQTLPVAIPDRGPLALARNRDPAASAEDAVEIAPSEVAPSRPDSGSGRPAAGLPQTPALQPPQLRALAERTSRPIDETRATPSQSPADPKATGPATTPVMAADQPTKPAPLSAPLLTPPQPDAAATSQEVRPAGPATAEAEAAVPTRDQNLSTLSRTAIDATAQIAAQILRKLEGRSTRFEIALRPAELGRVDVKLEIDAEGRLAARLAFDNPAAATDLRGRVDELRRQLEAADFQLADDAIEFAERDSGSSAFDRGQNARDDQKRAFTAASRLNAEIDVAQPPRWMALSLSPSGVDMKV